MPNLALCPRQRLVDDFLLSPEMVLESFLSYGLVEEAVEYAKVRASVVSTPCHTLCCVLCTFLVSTLIEGA